MTLTEAMQGAIRGDITAIRSLRIALEQLFTCETFQTHDTRDEIALAHTLGVFHRVERRLRRPFNQLPNGTRHASYETLRDSELV